MHWQLTRAGNIDVNPTNIEQRAQTFASGSKSATLVTTMDDNQMRHYLSIPYSSSANNAGMNLAQTVAAQLNVTDEGPDLTFAPHVAQLRWVKSTADISSTQVNVDLTQLSKILGDSMPDGSWVAATVRNATRMERSRWSNWLAYRMGSRRPTHHSTKKESQVTTLWAGAQSPAAARDLASALAAALPGFDIGTRPVIVSRFPTMALFFLFAIAFGGLGFFAEDVSSFFTGFDFDNLGALVTEMHKLWFLLSGAFAALAALTGARILPVRAVRVHRGLTRGRLPKAGHRIIPPRKPKTVDSHIVGAEAREDGGAYPLVPTGFMLGAHIPAALVAPHAGSLSGESAAKARGVPRSMMDPIGPFIGNSVDGRPAFLPAFDAGRGLAVFGRPGSGKSVLIQNVYAWSSMERVKPTGIHGSPGRNNALVYFETKLDGARKSYAWSKGLGDTTAMVEISNPDSFAIDLFDVPGNVEERAIHFTNALKYAFADGSIQDESFRTLKVVLTGGLVVDDEIVARVERLDKGRSPIYYAAVLMGRNGDEMGQQLSAAIHDAERLDPSNIDLKLAVDALALMYGPTVSTSQRANFQRAPGNKLDQLLALEHFFSPQRRKFSWQQLLDQHVSAIILTGRDSMGNMMESNMESIMSSLLLFSLRYNIERHCVGWEEANRWVSIFADELKDLAGSSPDVVTWLHDRGRSYGVRLALATQFPHQLDEQVRQTLFGFPNLVSFVQSNTRVASEVAEDFASGGSEWSGGDVLNLETYQAIVRGSVGQRRQEPFQFRSIYFFDGDTPRVEEFVQIHRGGQTQ